MDNNREQLYRAVHPEGTHLASSKDTEGSYRGVLLDNETNRVVARRNSCWLSRNRNQNPSRSRRQ